MTARESRRGVGEERKRLRERMSRTSRFRGKAVTRRLAKRVALRTARFRECKSMVAM